MPPGMWGRYLFAKGSNFISLCLALVNCVIMRLRHHTADLVSFRCMVR